MSEIEDAPVNLPRYECQCKSNPACDHCEGSGWLSYSKAISVYKGAIPLSVHLPQCCVCTRFETEDNPLFAYTHFEGENGDYKLIYRCLKGHNHDHGKTFLDILTGLEVDC